MSEAPDSRTKHAAPWRGRKRVKDARTRTIPPIRCTEEERAAIKAAADRAGLSVSGPNPNCSTCPPFHCRVSGRRAQRAEEVRSLERTDDAAPGPGSPQLSLIFWS